MTPLRSSKRVRLIAYSCDGGDITMSPSIGWMTMGDVYAYRPANCRYAIIQSDGDTYIIVDLFEAMLTTDTGELTFYEAACSEHTTLDAAVMASILRN